MRIRDPESFRPWIREQGWKNLDPRSGINIPDPQHCLNANISKIATIKFKLYFMFLTCRISQLKNVQVQKPVGRGGLKYVWLLGDGGKS
jgi:hypothetical protein